MNVTLYSLLTALVVSGIFSLLLVLLSFQTTWIMKLGLWPLCVRASDVAAGGNALCQTSGAGTGKRQCLAEPPPVGRTLPGRGTGFFVAAGYSPFAEPFVCGLENAPETDGGMGGSAGRSDTAVSSLHSPGKRQCLHSQRHQSTIHQRVFHPHHRFASGPLAGRGPASHSPS